MSNDQQYVTLGIDREIFAISVSNVEEILDVRPIARLPRAPNYLMGLMDVRGVAIPIVDLRIRLGLSPIEPTSRTRVLIVESDGLKGRGIGLMADCVFEVTDLAGADVDVPPSVGARWRSDCIAGIGKRGDDFVIILRLANLLEGDDLLAATRAA